MYRCTTLPSGPNIDRMIDLFGFQRGFSADRCQSEGVTQSGRRERPGSRDTMNAGAVVEDSRAKERIWVGRKSLLGSLSSYEDIYKLRSGDEIFTPYFFERGTSAPFCSKALQSFSKAHLSLTSISPESKRFSGVLASHPISPTATFAVTFASAIHFSMSLVTADMAILYWDFNDASRVVILRRLLYCFNMGIIRRSEVFCGSRTDDGFKVGRK